MTRFFNTAGPCFPERHYMLSPEERLPNVRGLIDDGSYFVLHAPRQVGKTTSLLSLAQKLTQEGKYAAALLSMEVGQPFGDDPGAAEDNVLNSWRRAAQHELPPELQPPPVWPQAPGGSRIGSALDAWCKHCPKPLVLFLDEIDALHNQALIAVLRQLRDGFSRRPKAFPWSLALIGLRDVRDYKMASGGSTTLGTVSPFNIKTDSTMLRNFTADEVAELYQQHTDETGQRFCDDAKEFAFELTQGQPWLVNALARQCVTVLRKDGGDVTRDDILQAKEILIQRRDTHLDSLVDKLKEERVKRVIEPIMVGKATFDARFDDDFGYARDLGPPCQTQSHQ